ncbi:MAG: hypothetical protein IPM42_21195 [Saprospiraceae bacterium]|nr:hypothetical protein [Saprospiraceae bacterium]
MDIKIVIIFSLLFITLNSCKEKYKISKCNYYFAKSNTYINTVLDTSKLIEVTTFDYTGESEIAGHDTIQDIRYQITWGSTKPDIDWSPFTNLTYDTSTAKNILNNKYENRPIYLINVRKINGKNYISACFEQKYLGITISSNYYSDTFNILTKTIFYHQYDFKKIDINKHFEILENTEICRR